MERPGSERRLARKLFGLAATTVVVEEKTKVQASLLVRVGRVACCAMTASTTEGALFRPVSRRSLRELGSIISSTYRTNRPLESPQP